MQISKEALDHSNTSCRNCAKYRTYVSVVSSLHCTWYCHSSTSRSLLSLRSVSDSWHLLRRMMGGPVMGFTVGFLGDMLNCFVRGFSYFPGFSLSYALVGALCGLVLYRSKITKLRAVACALVEFVISITLTSTWLYLMYGTPLQVLLTTRIIKCTMNFFVNIVIIYVFLEALQKVVRVALPARR